MTSSLSSQSSRSVVVPSEFFAALRASTARSAEAVGPARDAGYAAGVALYDTFGEWLAEHGQQPAELLPEDEFGTLLADFLTAAGWGALGVVALSDAVMALDSTEWPEAEETAGASAPSCHVGTGLLAGFLGRLADAPLAVLEVECRSAGAPHCRFVVGSVDVLQYIFEAMERGVSYQHAASSAASG